MIKSFPTSIGLLIWLYTASNHLDGPLLLTASVFLILRPPLGPMGSDSLKDEWPPWHHHGIGRYGEIVRVPPYLGIGWHRRRNMDRVCELDDEGCVPVAHVDDGPFRSGWNQTLGRGGIAD